MKSTPAACLGFVLSAAALPVAALTPSELFEKLSPSVWVVRTYDAGERPLGQGSAVVIGNGKLVTNCHVLAKAKMVSVRRRNVSYEASLEHADTARDLCLLSVEGFAAPAVALGTAGELKVGQRVFAIGNPKGLEVTLSEGLVSGLRGEWSDGSHVIQTTAPFSPGSSGGGLFDEQGRLVGITTFIARDAQNLNFALPAEWIAQVPERAKAALAARDAPKTAGGLVAPPGYPAPGTVWVYRFTERAYGVRSTDVTVRADRVDRGFIEESITTGDGAAARRTIQTESASFITHKLRQDVFLMEVAPYLGVEGEQKAQQFSPGPYPNQETIDVPARGMGWLSEARVTGWEEVVVPAGTYRALRYEVEGRREREPMLRNMRSITTRFKLTGWYAPDIRRVVKVEHQTWAFAAAPATSDTAELIEYRPPR
jgi:S1-C subfamily serine protease